MWGRATGLAAALLMGTPGLTAPASDRVIWIEVCDALHQGVRIPLPLRREGDGAPAKACHAACSVLPDRRQMSRR